MSDRVSKLLILNFLHKWNNNTYLSGTNWHNLHTFLSSRSARQNIFPIFQSYFSLILYVNSFSSSKACNPIVSTLITKRLSCFTLFEITETSPQIPSYLSSIYIYGEVCFSACLPPLLLTTGSRRPRLPCSASLRFFSLSHAPSCILPLLICLLSLSFPSSLSPHLSINI